MTNLQRLALALFVTSCGAPVASVATLPVACDLELPAGFERLKAGGVIAAQTDAGVVTAAGQGCALEFGPPVSDGQLQDVDDDGALFVRVVTLETPTDTLLGPVVRVELAGPPRPVVAGGRGVSEFTIAPSANAFWFTGVCAGSGVYQPDPTTWNPAHLTKLFDVPTGAREGVLPDDAHFFSLSGQALTVTTKDGTRELPATLTWATRLTRCGHDVCSFEAGLITRWSSDGAVLRRESLLSLGGAEGETISDVTSPGDGLYVTFASKAGLRVRFVP